MNHIVFTLNETVLLLAGFEAFLLAVFFGILPGHRDQSKFFLRWFFLCISGTLIFTMLVWNKRIQESSVADFTFLTVFLSLFWMFQGPALYFYLKSLHTVIKLKDYSNFLHIISPVLVALIILIQDIDVNAWLPWNWKIISEEKHETVLLVWAILKCFPIVYIVTCFYTEYKARLAMKDLYSNIDDKSFGLADLVIYGYFIHWFWSFFAYILSGHVSGHTSHMHGVLSNYLTVIFINLVFVFGWKNKRELLKMEFTQQQAFNASDENRSRRQSLTSDKGEVPEDVVPPESLVDPKKIERIENAIKEKKLHLETQINLERFAEHVSIKPRELSYIINTVYKVNFFEFINNYRVEEAKRLLELSEESTESMLDILYQSGFNSQSAFHRFFKRITGITPSQYKKLHVLQKNTTQI